MRLGLGTTLQPFSSPAENTSAEVRDLFHVKAGFRSGRGAMASRNARHASSCRSAGVKAAFETLRAESTSYHHFRYGNGESTRP